MEEKLKSLNHSTEVNLLEIFLRKVMFHSYVLSLFHSYNSKIETKSSSGGHSEILILVILIPPYMGASWESRVPLPEFMCFLQSDLSAGRPVFPHCSFTEWAQADASMALRVFLSMKASPSTTYSTWSLLEESVRCLLLYMKAFGNYQLRVGIVSNDFSQNPSPNPILSWIPMYFIS